MRVIAAVRGGLRRTAFGPGRSVSRGTLGPTVLLFINTCRRPCGGGGWNGLPTPRLRRTAQDDRFQVRQSAGDAHIRESCRPAVGSIRSGRGGFRRCLISRSSSIFPAPLRGFGVRQLAAAFFQARLLAGVVPAPSSPRASSRRGKAAASCRTPKPHSKADAFRTNQLPGRDHAARRDGREQARGGAKRRQAAALQKVA
jgi:hypothetical protein